MSNQRDLEIFESAEAAAVRGADLFFTAAREAIAEQGRFTVALSGGSTPIPLFRRLAEEALGSGLDWSAVHIFWADERCVPPDHPESNYRLAEDLFLSKLPTPGATIHRVAGELSPDEAACHYETELVASFPDEEIPVFDLLLLGVGSDGHTASLFPGMDLERLASRKAVAVYVEKLQSSRVTLTLPVLVRARRTIFLVTGVAKATIVREILGDGEDCRCPASRVASTSARVTWLLDQEAAGGIVHP
ncbi:MAG: 6-phosphogluconolactonase [Geobacteraceae bacterium]